MADIEEPLDTGRITHLTAQMHRSEDDDGDPIPDGYLLAADGAKGHTWTDPSGLVPTGLDEVVVQTLGYQAHGTTGSTETFDASVAGWHSATLDDDCTFTFTGATSGEAWGLTLELLQDGTGGWTVTWPGSVAWPGGSAPTLSTAPGSTDVLVFFTRDGGTNWFGYLTGGGGGTGSALEVLDEGGSLDTAVTSIDFVGAGVTASNTGHAVTVTIPTTSHALDDLTDVVITSPSADEQLQYVGGSWVNNSRRWEPVTTNPGTGPELVWDGDDIVMTWRTY